MFRGLFAAPVSPATLLVRISLLAATGLACVPGVIGEPGVGERPGPPTSPFLDAAMVGDVAGSRPDGAAPKSDGPTSSEGRPEGTSPQVDTAARPDVSFDVTNEVATAPRCSPTAGGPHWVEEGAPLRIAMTCATGLAAAPGEFAIDGLPVGAHFDSAAGVLLWTPTLDQAAVYQLDLRYSPNEELGTVKIGVADRFDDPANIATVDPLTYTEEFGLPVMHLSTAPEIGRDVYTPATIIYRGRRYTAEAQYRGASSFNYPKKNFTLRFAKDDKFDEPALGDQFLGRRKITLITTFDDVSGLRARMAFTLWKRMDPHNVALTTYSGVVFLNGRYQGLYTIADKIDGNLMQRHGHAEHGQMFMAINHDANFAPFLYDEPNPQNETRRKTAHEVGWEKKEGLPETGPGALAEIVALSRWAAETPDAQFVNEVAQKIDVNDYVNWLVLATTIQAWDTLGKNAFHYRDPLAATPLWRVIPWDFNESFGQRWQTARFGQLVAPRDILWQAMGGFGYTNRNYLWRRLWAHPTIGPLIRARFGEVLRGSWKAADVMAWFDAMASETAGAAKRDERKWGAAHRSYYRRTDFLSHTDEVAYVRRWMVDRWQSLTSVQ